MNVRSIEKICALKPEDVIAFAGPTALASRRDWARVQSVQRLVWQYGPTRTLGILQGGELAYNLDLARWNALGRRSAA